MTNRIQLDDVHISRFKTKILTCSATNCWLWSGAKDRRGYGMFRVGNSMHLAPRIAYMLYNNSEITDGMYVCHRCDVPSCVNPDHLFLGTPKDNVQDAIAKGRFKRSSGNPCRYKGLTGNDHKWSKLNEKQVLDIRSTYRYRKVTMQELADLHGVTKYAIYNILHRKTWKHI